jgi:glycosyltransferase involved in cell wall biosynthesis
MVIPAWNEVETIVEVAEGARAALEAGDEVLVVDDGSTDGTAARAEDAGFRVVRIRPNQGKGRALRRGIEEASHDLLLFIDADGQDDPGELSRLIEALEPDVAMVIGSRFLGTLHDGSITPSHKVGNRVLTGLFNVLYGCALTDTQAGFRLVRRSALDVEQLRAVRYEIETELTLHVLRRGGRVVEVPVSRERRPHGASGFGTAYDGLRVLAKMVTGRVRSVR